MNKRQTPHIFSVGVFTVFIFLGLTCASSISAAPNSKTQAVSPAKPATPTAPAAPVNRTPPPPALDELDTVIREASTYLNGKIQPKSKVVFLNIQSVFPDLSEYIISVLSENAVNDNVFLVVDRQQLDVIRSELNFQLSGEVSDESAQSIGQMLGAQTIVSGTVTKIGALYRLQVKAIAVQTAAIQGQWSRNIPDGATIAALTINQSSGATAQTRPSTSSTAPTASQTTSATNTPSQTTATANVATLTSIEQITAYLSTVTGRASNPAPLKVAISLGTMTRSGSDWHKLLTTLENSRKFVALDLSACTMDGKVFDPRVGNNEEMNIGASYIVEIILPNAATSIADGLNGDTTFKYFTNLKKAGGNVATIGKYAFRGLTNLTAVSFPEATNIGESAFSSCSVLTIISFPEAMSIGNSAFSGCSSLTTISFPEVMNIADRAFFICGGLTTASFPKTTNIGNWAFRDCNGLTSITLGTITPPNFDGDRMTFNYTNLRDVYFQQPEGERAGRYTRSQGGNNWSKR